MKTYFRIFTKNKDVYHDCDQIYRLSKTRIGYKCNGYNYSINENIISSISHFLVYSNGKFDRTEISINLIY